MNPIFTPRITSPTNSSIRATVPFLSSAYERDKKFHLTHERSEWQLATDKEFNNIILEEETTRVTRAWTPDMSSIRKQRVYIRVRYVANTIKSEWSDPVVFTTI